MHRCLERRRRFAFARRNLAFSSPLSLVEAPTRAVCPDPPTTHRQDRKSLKLGQQPETPRIDRAGFPFRGGNFPDLIPRSLSIAVSIALRYACHRSLTDSSR
jgi:hypothetical protein